MATKFKNEDYGLPSVSIVMGYLATKDCETIDEKVKVLSMLGYGRNEIAQICGTTTNTVSVSMNRLKSKNGKNKKTTTTKKIKKVK